MPMKAKLLMIQGTGSHVGKSLLVTALCRHFARQGYRVAPFKAQNMSLNSAVCCGGGEIGRAQALQATACYRAPSVDMNPVLLKPSSPTGCQVVVLGAPLGSVSASEYGRYSGPILKAVTDAFDRLASVNDIVILEGAGSPAEVNLLDRDIANMRMAEHAGAPVILVGDIERGGVFAALLGTWMIVPHPELVQGYIINKFRGDAALLGSGIAFLERRTGVPTLGVVPFRDPQLPEEDSLALPRGVSAGRKSERLADADAESDPTFAPARNLTIGIVRLPHISNFTDFQPLEREPGVTVRYIASVEEVADADVVILPGTKSTVADLEELRAAGLAAAIIARAKKDRPVLGICGGYQMLGDEIEDEPRVESPRDHTEGLRLLPITTRFSPEKATATMDATLVGTHERVHAYQIQHGRVSARGGLPLFEIADNHSNHPEGCRVGRVWGTSLHGIFDEPGARRSILEQWRQWCQGTVPAGGGPSSGMVADFSAAQLLDQQLDAWSSFVVKSLDMVRLHALVGLETAGHD
jgi:adenosylcobyric acid synthase